MSESTTDEEYIYKLELLKRKIEEQRARNVEFYGSPYAAENALWGNRRDPLQPVQNVSPWQQELANFLQLQRLKADLSKPEVQEIISPCMQQDRKILI